MRRAVDGVDRPVYQTGELVGYERMYSDQLLVVLLRRHIAEYRDRSTIDLNATGGVLIVPGVAGSNEEWESQANGKRAVASVVAGKGSRPRTT